MAALSTYMENQIIEFMRGSAVTGHAAVYVALFTSDDGLESGIITGEVSGGAYARELAGLIASVDGVTENGADITFTTATAVWGNITHIALMDAAVAGNVIMHGAVTEEKVVGDGDTYKILAGQLDASMT